MYLSVDIVNERQQKNSDSKQCRIRSDLSTVFIIQAEFDLLCVECEYRTLHDAFYFRLHSYQVSMLRLNFDLDLQNSS